MRTLLMKLSCVLSLSAAAVAGRLAQDPQLMLNALIFGSAVVVAHQAWEHRPRWAVAFAFAAVAYNPFYPVIEVSGNVSAALCAATAVLFSVSVVTLNSETRLAPVAVSGLVQRAEAE